MSLIVYAQLFDMIAKAKIDFSGLEKEGVAPAAVDLLKKLLHVDPKKRITAREALQHPWVKVRLRPARCSSSVGNCLRALLRRRR